MTDIVLSPKMTKAEIRDEMFWYVQDLLDGNLTKAKQISLGKRIAFLMEETKNRKPVRHGKSKAKNNPLTRAQKSIGKRLAEKNPDMTYREIAFALTGDVTHDGARIHEIVVGKTK